MAYPGDVYAGRGVVRQRGVLATRPQRGVVVSASEAAAPTVRTRLTLHVPADSRVTLAGVATRQSGEVREFATARLAEGQVWDDYKVVVELDRDGERLREERTIRLVGGEAQELSIDFDSTQIAQR